MSVLARISDIIWGPALLGAFLLVGLYFSLGTGFFQLVHLPVFPEAPALLPRSHSAIYDDTTAQKK